MNPDLLRKLISSIAIAAGLWWGGFIITNLFAVSIFILIMMSLPAILAVVFGIQLFREMSIDNLKWVFGAFAVFAFFRIASLLETPVASFASERMTHSFCQLLGAVIIAPIYLFAVRETLPFLNVAKPKLSSLVGRGLLFALAFLIWMFLSDLFREFSPVKEGYTHVLKEPWGTLSVLVPILTAWLGYRFAVSRLDRSRGAARSSPNS